MLVPGIVASGKSTAPSAYAQLIATIAPDAWYRLNEGSGVAVFDSIAAEEGLASIVNVQGLPITDYTEDPGSLDSELGENVSVPNSIDSWLADSDNLQTCWMSFWIKVDSLAAAPFTVFENVGDPTQFSVVVNANGSVTMTYSQFGVATSPPGAVVVGERVNISWWCEYVDNDFTFSTVNLRHNIGGVPLSGSSNATYDPARFPNLNLGGFDLGNFDGQIDELFLKYGNAINADPISQANGIAWSQAIWDLQP